MKLDEYKGLMGELNMPQSLKEKIMNSAALGREPRPLGERRSHPRLMKTLSIAAMVATLAVVITAFVLLVRFVGPAGPDTPSGSNQSFEASGFKLVSISTGCDEVSAKVVGYDPDEKSIYLEWTVADGYDAYIHEHEAMKLSYLTEAGWEILAMRGGNAGYTVYVDSYVAVEQYGPLSLLSYDLEGGRYKLERPFELMPELYIDGSGQSSAENIGDAIGEYNLTVEFELTESQSYDEGSNGFRLISISTDCEGVDAELVSYDSAEKRMTVRWLISEGVTVPIFAMGYKLQKHFNGELIDIVAYPDESDLRVEIPCKNGYLHGFDLDADYENVGAGYYRLTREFTANSQIHYLTIEFELTDESEKTDENSFNIVSVDTGHESVTVDSIKYDDAKKEISASWSIGDVKLTYGYDYTIEKLIDGNWVTEADVDFYFEEHERQNESWTDTYSLSLFTAKVTEDRYRLQKVYWLDGKGCVMTIVFELSEADSGPTDIGPATAVISDRGNDVSEKFAEVDAKVVRLELESGILWVDISNKGNAVHTVSGVVSLVNDSGVVIMSIEIPSAIQIPVGKVTHKSFDLSDWKGRETTGDFSLLLTVDGQTVTLNFTIMVATP